MSFSTEWEEAYKANTQMSIWPWSDLVSYVMRFSRPQNKSFKVLELGCGAGANIPFFKHLGIQYYAMEGSEHIVKELLHKKFPEFARNIIVGDFTKEIPFKEQFDLIFDRAAITHNTTIAIQKTITYIYERLKPNGKFIGIDWFSTAGSGYQEGVMAEDNFTRNGYTKGYFAGVGRVHFSDKPHLQELFSSFILDRLEHKLVLQEIPEDKYTLASWNFIARKG